MRSINVNATIETHDTTDGILEKVKFALLKDDLLNVKKITVHTNVGASPGRQTERRSWERDK